MRNNRLPNDHREYSEAMTSDFMYVLLKDLEG